MVKILETDTSKILESFRTAYYEQIGKYPMIGSEEYTLSSIFSYVLSVHAGMINDSCDNRFIDTASGEFLDKIAESFGLSRRKYAVCNPYFEGMFYWNDGTDAGVTKPAGSVSYEIAGHTYKNENEFVTTNVQIFLRFESTEPHSDALSKDELKDELATISDFHMEQTTTILNDGLLAISDYLDDDEAFRKYIKENIMLFAPGMAESFEQLAKLACSEHIAQAYCVRQSDPDYEAGDIVVKLKFKPEVHTLIRAGDIIFVNKLLQNWTKSLIGYRSITAKQAEAHYSSRSIGTVYYKKKDDVSGNISDMFNLKKSAIEYYITNTTKIGETIYISTVVDMMINPLSKTSENADDFGLSQSDYDSIKQLSATGVYSAGTPLVSINPYDNGADYIDLTISFSLAVE